MRFEWDTDKAARNNQAHGISFDEAIEVFTDPNAFEDFDPSHSDVEPRYRRVGLSSRRLLLVVFAERAENVIRIVSARKSTTKERERYEEAQG